MNKVVFLFLASVASFSLYAQSYTSVESVPNPKTTSQDGFVSNPDNIISNATEADINGVLANLREQHSYEVAVVLLESIGQNVPEDFANDLFNHWGLGTVQKENGLLILLVEDQRTVRFETGYGTETVLSDVECKRIQEDHMVPYFKQGDYDRGILNGVSVAASRLAGKEIADFVESPSVQSQSYGQSSAIHWGPILLFVLGWHVIGIVPFLIALIIIRTKFDPYKKWRIIRYFHVLIWPIVFPLTHIFLYFLAKQLKNRYRNMIRFSGKTGEIMHKLDEHEEDEFLSKGQQAEEIVRSVDYDVWTTEKHDDLLVLEYRPFFTKYSKCPKCSFTTYYKEYDRQTLAPTYYSSGRGERKHRCANCQHENIKTYTIPRLRKSSRTSSGGGGSWSGGGGSWSGGGSWGGGSSGGGGASSSW